MKREKFSEEYLKPALGLFGCHVAGVIIAFIFCMSLSRFIREPAVSTAVCAVIVLLIYCIPIYGKMWGEGHRDINRVKVNTITKDMSKGFKVGALMSIPSFVIALLFVLSKFNLFYNFIVVFKLLNAEIMPLINLIKNKPFLPDYQLWEIIAIALLTVIPMLLSGVFYILGYRDFAPINRLVYKKRNEKVQVQTSSRPQPRNTKH